MQAKYQRISDELRQKINLQEFQVNAPIPSELQLQKEYQVSRHTIRQAIALLVNEGYLRREKGSGTYVEEPKLLSQKSSAGNKTIGVITTYVSDYIFPSIIRGIEKTLRESGYSLLLASTNNNYAQEKECLEKMLAQNVQGLIIEPTKSNQYNPNLALYVKLKEKQMPIVMINASYEELNLPKISVDDVKAGFLATELLIKSHHSELLLLTKIDDLQGKYRMMGFMQACEKYQINLSDESIITYTTETKKNVLQKVYEQIVSRSITGVICYNDEAASRLIHLLEEQQLQIPEDISIVGNDNSTLSKIGSVKLSTLEHPKEKMGIEAANWLIKTIQSGKSLPNVQFQPIVIERESVKNLALTEKFIE